MKLKAILWSQNVTTPKTALQKNCETLQTILHINQTGKSAALITYYIMHCMYR